MNKKIITVPSGTKYLSEIISDLPHNAYINKGLTGIGGTTIALTNDEYYVVAVHTLALVENKMQQHNHVLGVFGQTTNNEIQEYVANGGKKIIVTYDSLCKVISNIDTKQFRLLVDEVQVLIRYTGVFKIKVCNSLIDRAYEFKSVSYLTATPTPLQYLPKPMQELDYVEYKWEDAVKPSIRHKYVGNLITTKVVAYILDKYFNTNTDIFIFFNSLHGVTTTTKKLLKAEDSLSLNDINMFFAHTEKNIRSMRQSLGKTFNMSVPLIGNEKRINFVSSFGFEGIDFYNKDVSILVVSDSKSKSMRYDISIDLPQIVGRFRNVPNAVIDFIWSSYTDQASMDEEEFIRQFKHEESETKEMVNMTEHNSVANKAAIAYIEKTQTAHMYMTDDNKVMINKYAYESLMSSFSAMHCDYYVMKPNEPVSSVLAIDKAMDIFNVNDTLEIAELSLKHTKNLNRVFSFKKLAKEYVSVVDALNSIEIIDKEIYKNRLDELLQYSEDLLKYHNVLTTQNIRSKGYNKKELDLIYDDYVCMNKMGKNPLNLELDKTYTFDEIKNKITILYVNKSVNKKPMTTHVMNWYNVKKTSLLIDGKPINSYKILSYI